MNRRNGKLGMVLTLVTALLLQPCAGIKADAKTVLKSVTVYCGKTKTVKKWKAGAVKGFKVTYSRKNVAAVKVKKNGIQITGKKAGTVKVTVKVTKKNKKTDTYKYKVTVKKKSAPEEETDVKESIKPEQTTKPSPAASTKPTPIVELITSAPVVTPVPTEDTYVSDYSYELEVLNSGTLYTNTDIYVYVKTNKVEANYGDIGLLCTADRDDDDWFDENGCYIEGNRTMFGADVDLDDVNFVDDGIVIGAHRPVSGGYLYGIKFDKPGTHTVLMYEMQDGVRHELPETEFCVNVLDYSEAETAWIDRVITEQTTDTMTMQEKMLALTNYVYNEFSYRYNSDSGLVKLLHTESKPYWESKRIDCWDATYILIQFANRLGLEAEATDGSDKPGAGALHQYATVYIDGVAYEYDASPASATGYITEWEYVL